MQWQRVEGDSRRSVRFPIAVPLRYRATPESAWCDGETVNISGSGVLFRADRPLQPPTSVEITLTLPVRVAGTTVRCDFRGEVVRALASLFQERAHVIAARIVEYRFVREDDPADDQPAST